jgi:hypothetical protein
VDPRAQHWRSELLQWPLLQPPSLACVCSWEACGRPSAAYSFNGAKHVALELGSRKQTRRPMDMQQVLETSRWLHWYFTVEPRAIAWPKNAGPHKPAQCGHNHDHQAVSTWRQADAQAASATLRPSLQAESPQAESPCACHCRR